MLHQSLPPEPPASDGDGAPRAPLRLWMSDQQWVTLLERVARQAVAHGQGGDRERRDHSQTRYRCRKRCMLRLGHPGASPGTYVVEVNNLSAGGLCLIHDAPVETGTRCTLAIQDMRGAGCIISGRVAWCRALEPGFVQVGVQFAEPIDAADLLDSDNDPDDDPGPLRSA